MTFPDTVRGVLLPGEVGDLYGYDTRGVSPVAVRIRTDGASLSAILTDPSPSSRRAAATGAGLDASLGGILFSRQPGEHRLFVTSYPDPPLSRAQAYEVIVTPVDTFPEGAPSRLRPGDVTTTSLHGDGDVDIFGVTLPPGSLISVFAQPLDRLPWWTAEVTRAAGGETVPLFGNTPLGAYTHAIDARSGDSLRVFVGGRQGVFEAGRVAPYRLEVYPIQRAPEIAPAVLTFGDPVFETLERPVDIDEFRWSAREERLYSLVRYERDGTDRSTVAVRNHDGSLLVDPLPGADSVTTSGFFGAGTGERTVRVEADGGDAFDVPYRFSLHEVDPAPETAPREIEPGTRFTAEAMSAPDIDEFELVASEATLATLVVQKLSADLTGDLSVLVTREGEPLDRTIRSWQRDETFPLTLRESGRYPIRITSELGYDGPYGIFTSTYEPGPEEAPATLHVGDRVTESVQPLADVDAYVLRPSVPRQYFDLVLAGHGKAGGAPIYAELHYVDGWPITGGTTPDGQMRIPLRITDARPIDLSVHAGRMGAEWSDIGGYTLSLEETPVGLEHVPGRELAPFDSVSRERLDGEGDIDRLPVRGAAGDQVAVGARTSAGGTLRVVLFDYADGRLLGEINAGGNRQFVKATFPEGGRIGSEVSDACLPQCTAGAEYELFSYPFDPAPETASPDLLPGDTIAEAIDRPADVDEFHFRGQAGAIGRISVARTGQHGRLPATIWTSLLGPSGQTVRSGGVSNTNPDVFLDLLLGALPVTGTYTIRVFLGTEGETDIGDYRLVLNIS